MTVEITPAAQRKRTYAKVKRGVTKMGSVFGRLCEMERQSLLDERDSNILRDVRAKIKTVADCYDIAPEYVVRVLLRAMEKSK